MKYLFVIFFILGACGGNETDTEYVREPAPAPSPNPDPPTSGVKNYAEIKPLLQESCGGASCHAGASFLQSEASLRANSQVKKRIASDSMPPSFAPNYFLWQDGTRKKDILDFLSN